MSANLTSLEEQALVAKLIEGMRQAGGWAGETHIQKSLFFLKWMLQVPFSYNFVLYKHGPYSFDLHDALGQMRANSFVRIEPRIPYGPSFGLGSLSDKLIQKNNEIVAKHTPAIDFIVESLSRNDVRDLEKLATALYLSEEGSHVNHHELAQRINQVKPHIPVEIARDAIKKVEQLQKEAVEQELIHS